MRKHRVDVREFRMKDQFLMPWSSHRTVSTARAAEMLQCSPRTVLNMIEAGELMAYPLRPNRSNSPLRVNKDSIERHIEGIRVKYSLPRT